MEIKELKKIFSGHKSIYNLIENINQRKNVHIKGLAGSLLSIISEICLRKTNYNQVLVLNDKEEAAYLYNDLNVLNKDDSILFFPSSYKRSVQYGKKDSTNIILRTDFLNAISTGKQKSIVITYPEALIEKVVPSNKLSENTLKISTGEKLSFDFLIDVLYEYNFERVDFVFEPGQFSVRGSIIDIYSFANEDPYRIDFFDDEIESIRTFSIENQLSKEKLDDIFIIPNLQDAKVETEFVSFFEFLPDNTVVWFNDFAYISHEIRKLYKNTLKSKDKVDIEENELDIEQYLIEPDKIPELVDRFTKVEFGNQPFFGALSTVDFNSKPQPSFNKNFELLADTLNDYAHKGYENFILSNNKKQIERIANIFEDKGLKVHFSPIYNTLHEGFVDDNLKLTCFTDHQIFNRYHKYKLKDSASRRAKEAITIRELNQLQIGDYVVHADHGIGKFGGLIKVDTNNNTTQESIKLIYKDNDLLFVSLHSLHKISKYKGKDSEAPKVHKLGSPVWNNLKNKTKSKIKDIAKDLIALYTQRMQKKGFAFTQDTFMQEELEASFIYEDTPDQEKATKAVKKGMEEQSPMDLLVCGDVGFGKTEIAIRAAFKAVADNKQVAILVPTTILAFQHYNTFKKRLKDFPCTIDYLSRLRTAKEKREISNKLKEGKIDIIIGTHILVGKEIGFKDLGLLVIDEEQKFGVKIKEKLRALKVNIDTLTLTATPIPRTLQFSLMGARDLAVINTPPPNRYPIITELHTFNEPIIKEVINYELDRGGQVFFLHNRVQNIYEVETLLQRLVPGVKTVVGHGQMEGKKLEKVMLDFIDGSYDILIATTIIESGLDIPNANTIIINNAQNFGLSELHQLRGRVGRTNKKAFCYLLAPPLHSVSNDSRRRLKAIEDFSELGSGFNIAMQDLDIRGAGNLLGGEQSGFINDIGYETYQRILNEALLELKETDFKELFNTNKGEDEEIESAEDFIVDCTIDTDFEILFPTYYIENIAERIKLYRELDNMNSDEEIEEFEKRLLDRFGKIPKPTQELIAIVSLRKLAKTYGFEKIILKNKKMVCYFITNQESYYYQSAVFQKVLVFAQSQVIKCQLKENKNKLMMSFNDVLDVKTAISILKKIN